MKNTFAFCRIIPMYLYLLATPWQLEILNIIILKLLVFFNSMFFVLYEVTALYKIELAYFSLPHPQ